jgi:hypothetical protein
LLLPAHCTTNADNFNPQPRADTLSVSAEVLAALPAGSAPARSQAAFLRAVEEHPDTAALRVDGREHLAAVAWVLASTASWTQLTARPTWAILQARTGLSRAAVARWLAWLRAHGLLGIVQAGTTPQFSPMALAADGQNRAALYLLCTPQPAPSGHDHLVVVEENETPTPLGPDLQENPYARASQHTAGSLRERKTGSYKRGRPAWSRTQIARSKAQRLALAERLQAEALGLRALSTPALRHLLRPWIARPELGWSVAWLLHALDHTPDGSPRTFTTPVRVPAGWLRYRLSAWLDQDGRPLPSPGVALAAAEQARRARAEQAQAEQAQRKREADEEQTFGQLIRDTAGQHYPALVETVLGRQPGNGRLMPAVAAEALTRQAIRDLLPGGGRDDESTTCVAVVAAVRGLLDVDADTTR